MKTTTGAALDLSVRIGPARLANPILTASGTFGYGDEYAHVVDPALLGAVMAITRSPAITSNRVSFCPGWRVRDEPDRIVAADTARRFGCAEPDQ